jgi:hypothetical protein
MKKGQSRIFEEVLLFGISVTIFITCFVIFDMYQSHYSFVSINDHASSVRDMIHQHIIELTRIDSMDASIVLDIPEQISGEYYHIYINDTHITIVTEESGKSFLLELRMLGSYSFSGEAASGKGEIIIYKKGNNIIIE